MIYFYQVKKLSQLKTTYCYINVMIRIIRLKNWLDKERMLKILKVGDIFNKVSIKTHEYSKICTDYIDGEIYRKNNELKEQGLIPQLDLDKASHEEYIKSVVSIDCEYNKTTSSFDRELYLVKFAVDEENDKKPFSYMAMNMVESRDTALFFESRSPINPHPHFKMVRYDSYVEPELDVKEVMSLTLTLMASISNYAEHWRDGDTSYVKVNNLNSDSNLFNRILKRPTKELRIKGETNVIVQYKNELYKVRLKQTNRKVEA